MKRLIIFFIAAFSLLVTVSCKKDFLDVDNPGFVTKELDVYNLTTTNYYLNGVYVQLAQKLFAFGSITCYPEIIADNIKPVTATSTQLAPHYNWLQTTSNSVNAPTASTNTNKIWQDGYSVIRACNFVVEKADEYQSENPTQANDLKAQALSVRAYVNFLLINIFAQSYNFTSDGNHPGIPLVLSSNWNASIDGRESVGEIYGSMIDDLTTAVSLFKDGASGVLFMNRNAAKALLARIYLFKNDFANAKNLAREVCAAVPIMPASATGYPSQLFTTNEKEALFQLLPAQQGVSLPSPTGSYISSYSTNYIGRYFVSPKYFIATNDIATLLTQYSTDNRKVWVSKNAGTWNISKYPQGVVAGFSVASNSYYQTLLRSSEMSLTAAEAYAKINNEDSARYFVNAIRTRANIPALTNAITGAALLDSIYTERRRELCFEGLRMFDLLRLKKGVNRSDYWGSAQSLPYPSSKAISPIPQQDVEAYGLGQNSDY